MPKLQIEGIVFFCAPCSYILDKTIMNDVVNWARNFCCYWLVVTLCFVLNFTNLKKIATDFGRFSKSSLVW